jgi:transcriptional regulator GlxA family with amidase domain
LRKLGDIEVVEERFVIDGNIWTASGVSAGIDLALEFIKHEAGEETAGKVQSFAEYYPSGKVYGTFQQDPKAPSYLSSKMVD